MQQVEPTTSITVSVVSEESTQNTTQTRGRHQPSLSTVSLNENEINLGQGLLNSDTTRKEYRKLNSFRNIMSSADILEENTSPTSSCSSPTTTTQHSNVLSSSTMLDSKVEEMISLISKEYPSCIVAETNGKSEWERDYELRFLFGPSNLNRYLGDDKFVEIKAYLFNKFLFLGKLSQTDPSMGGREYRIIRLGEDDWTVKGLSDDSKFINAFCLKLEGESEIFTTNESSKKRYWLEQLRRVLDVPIFTEKQMKAIRDNIHEYLEENTYSLEELQQYYTEPISELVSYKDLGENTQFIERKGITQDVHYATIEKVFQLLTDPSEHDGDFLFTFLLTYKSFTTSMDFLKCLKNRYNTPPPIGCTDFQEWKRKLYDIRLRVCEILLAWIHNFFYNFRKDLEVQNETHHFINDVIANSKMIKAANILQKCWDMKRKQRETFSAQQFQRQQQQLEALKRQLDEDKDKKKPSLFKKLFNFNSTSSESEAFTSASMSISDNVEDQLLDSSFNIARQMCMIDMEVFNRIQPKECLNQAWSDANRRKNAPNIFNFIERSNHLAIYVAFLILNTDTPKRRAKVVEKFIKIAFVLKNLNNFHSMRSIMMSLNSNSIYRLKKTWELVSQKRLDQYKELEKLVNISANSKILRDAMKQANLPSLPFMGILLSDLTFFEDGNPDERDGKINVNKRYQLASIIKRIVEYQKKPYDFPFHDCKSKWSNIYMAGRYSDEDLYNLSLEQEPRQQ